MATKIFTPTMLRGAGTRGVPEIPVGSSFTNTKSTLFDGLDDYVVTPANFDVLNGSSYFTISVWVKMLVAENCNIFYIAGPEINLWIRNTGKIDVSLSSGSTYGRSSDGAISVGSWANICWIYDGTQTRYNRYKLYVNGVSDMGGGTSGATVTTVGNATEGLNIGKSGGNKNIDEVSVFDSVLSVGDIATISAAPVDLNTALTTTPVAWWRMGDKVTSFPTIPDQIGSNDGTAYNENEATMIVSDVP